MFGMKVNGTTVFDEVNGERKAETWSSDMFNDRLNEKCGEGDFKDIEVFPLIATSEVANDLLMAIA